MKSLALLMMLWSPDLLESDAVQRDRTALSKMVADRETAERSPLSLSQVIASVKTNFPPLLAALQEQEIADGNLLSAEGRFDTVLRARTDLTRLGYYSNQRFDAAVEQPLPWQGLSLYSGYRIGEGKFPYYDGYYETRDLGEWRAGLKLPLLRGRATDSRRTELQKARIGQRLADLSIDAQKTAVVQAASKRYWDWVAAGQRYVVVQDLLRIARTRESLLEDSVRLGQMPAIEVTDNKRAIAQREAQLADAERILQGTAIELSLYYRDSNGQPILVTAADLPPMIPEPQPYAELRLEDDIRTALERRPELARLKGQNEQLQQDLKLARNDQQPQVDLFMSFNTDQGYGPSYVSPREWKGGISFEFPVQRRAAKGKQAALAAQQEQLKLRTTYAVDQVKADVQDAASALSQAYRRTEAAQDEVAATRQVEEAERLRYDLGEGTLFVLNLRELATAEAEIRLINAKADYQRAAAQYEYALAGVLQNW
jgi:outer membrane protein, heavy metal efflux system